MQSSKKLNLHQKGMKIKMYTSQQEAFASKLKQLRSISRISQTKLAKDINVSRSCLANYESGKRFPGADILEIIASYFKVSVDYLLTPHSSVFFERDHSYDISELLKEISSNGKLDISGISPISKIALFEFYNFLTEQENKSKKLKNA